MKKIILFIIILISLKSFGQTGKYPNYQTFGSDSTLVESKGALKSRLVNRPFTDTTQANTQRIKWYEGAQAWTTSDKRFWIRDSLNNKWILPAGTGGGGSDTANLIVANLGLGIPVLYPRNDTLFGGTLIAGTGITIDSAAGVITINATGGIYTGGSGITIVGTDIRNDLTTGLGVSNQTIIASTIAFGDLTLSTTSHASKGNIYFGTSTYNEGNNSLGIRTLTPTSPLHIVANVSLTDAPIRVDATTGAALAMTMQINASEGGGFKIIDGASSGYLPVLIGESFGVDGAGFSYIGEMPAADDVLDPLTAAITLEGRRTDETNLTAANLFVLRTADYAPKVTVNFAGNMAVGNNLAPTERLHVGGNIRFSGALMPNNTAGTSGYFLTSGGPGVPPTWTPGVAGGSDTVVIQTPFTGHQLAVQVSSDTLFIKSLIAGSNITLTDNGDSTITIAASGSAGEANTASNLGGGLANYSTKVGVDLRFNSFLASHFNLVSNQIEVDTATLFPIIRSTIGEEAIYLDYPLQADVDTIQISPSYLDSVWDAINAAGGSPDLSYDAANHQIDITGGGTSGTIPLADDDGATEGLASFAAADFTADANGNVVIDYTNGTAASGSVKGFLTSADWTTFNNKQAALTLTTTGTSGAATLVGATLNIPQYAGGGGTVTSVTGTTDRITVATGTTTPVIDIASTYIGQTSITTLGTIATGSWNATTIPVNKGGTGQTSFLNGELLIGNTTGNTLTKATLTGTTNQVVVTNSTGSITLSTPQDIHTSATPQFARIGIGGAASSAYGAYIQGSGYTIGGLGVATSTSAQVGADAYGAVITPTIVEAASGNHVNLTGLAIGPPIITVGSATVTDIQSLHVTGTPTGTISGRASALRVSGGLRLDGSTSGSTILNAAATAGTTTITLPATTGTIALTSDLTIYAPLASPTFTGVPAGPTATAGTNTTQLATTAFVLANGGYTLHVQALSANPVDGETDYFGQQPSAWTASGGVGRKVYIRKAGTIKIANIYSFSGTAGTGEAWSLYIRLNNTTDYLIETISVAAGERVWKNSALSITVAVDDYFEIKSVAPTFATNPATTVMGGYIYIE